MKPDKEATKQMEPEATIHAFHLSTSLRIYGKYNL